MKAFFSTILGLALVASLASCSTSPTKVLPKKDGKWQRAGNVKSTSIAGTSNTAVSDTLTFTATTFTSSAGGGSAGWSYDKSTEKLTVTQGSETAIYGVSEEKANSMMWMRSSSQTVFGNTFTLEENYTLTRLK